MKRISFLIAAIAAVVLLPPPATTNAEDVSAGAPRVTQTRIVPFGSGFTADSILLDQADLKLSTVQITVGVIEFGDTSQTCLRTDGCGDGCFSSTLFAEGFLGEGEAWEVPFISTLVETNPVLAHNETHQADLFGMHTDGLGIVDRDAITDFEGAGTIEIPVQLFAAYNVGIGCSGSVSVGSADGFLIITVVYLE